MSTNRIVIVTGLSGSGRSAALKAFEDMGYYCTDNLPLALLMPFIEHVERSEEGRRCAIGIDVREREFPEQFPRLLAQLNESGHAIEVVFLEAMDRVLVRRFSETRRPHPLARGDVPLLDGIRREREALAGIKKHADQVIDTTDYTVHDLRQTVERLFSSENTGRPMVITMLTFGYKHGIPYEVDLLFDLRFLPNPHFREELKNLTGEHPDVREYVVERPDSEAFLSRLLDFLIFLLPRYGREGKSYLTIGFGCTGGRHRSVAVSLEIAASLRQKGYDVVVKHRDKDSA